MDRTPEEIMHGITCCEKYMNGTPEEECCHVCNYQYSCAELKIDIIALIKHLEAENALLRSHLKEAAARGGVCVGGRHANESGDVPKKCEDLDFDCERCTEKCACHSCENSCNYEWQGLSPE